MTPRCHICDSPLSPVAQFDGWCDACNGKALAELLSMCDLRPGELVIMADMFRQVQCPFLARVITRVPFGGGDG